MKLTKNEAIKQLTTLRAKRVEVQEAVKRKRSLLESERIMWLMDLDRDVTAIDLAIESLGEKSEAKAA